MLNNNEINCFELESNDVLVTMIWGPFLEGPEKFSLPESHSKLAILLVIDLFNSRIFDINIGSLHTRSFTRIYFPVLICR